MKMTSLLAAAFAVTLAVTGITTTPAAAAPAVPAKPAVQSAQDSLKVEVWHRRHHGHFRHFRPRHGLSFGIVIGPRYGHYRHYRHHRPYYDPYYVVRPRYHHHRRAIRIADPHVRWCYNRYRSYDRYSNSFQPYHGRRRTCVSPYY